jgi:hypothetical protein
MTERPINLHPHEVRAALAGTLGLIVRPIDRVAGLGRVTCFSGSETTGYDFALRDRRDMWNEFREDGLLRLSPFGQPGDKLWGRETFRFDFDIRIESDKLTRSTWQLAYGADEPELRKVNWRPSTHLPRWASRITFETTSIAVKQVRDITEAEAMACGFERPVISPREINGIAVHPMTGEYVDAFRTFWQKQYGDAQWAWFCSVKGAE